MNSSSTEALAEYISSVQYEDLPTELVEKIKRQCLDVVGVGLVGSTEPAGQHAAAFSTRFNSAPISTVWGASTRTSPPEAAFANGVAAHATDYDDMWLPGAHPTAPIFCAAFALAESIGASGKELIAAQLAGYELMGRLHTAVSGRAGWHPTGVFGTFGAVAACSRLLHLDTLTTCNAIGIASSSTSGLDSHGGTMTKPFHAGQAARNGVASALLAQSGFTANPIIFDWKRSFFDAFWRELPVQMWRLTVDLGKTFHLMTPGIGIKMYPAGYYMHQTFEAALKVVVDNDLVADDISEVVIGIRPGSRFDRAEVKVGLEGKFSLQYVAALAILQRGLTVHDFADNVSQSKEVQNLLQRIRVQADPSVPENADITFNPVTMHCTDGRIFSASVPLPKSHWSYPLTREEWIGKFDNNANGVLDKAAIDSLRDALENLENIENVAEIGKLLVVDSDSK